jgi:hypothetical protein
VRSQAKATSAGSTQGQGGKGHRRRLARPGLVPGLLLALLVAACLAPASALASTSHVFDSSFGPDCTEGTTFSAAGPVAVDQGTGDVYVADLETGTVYRCAADGTPAEFTAGPGAGTNAIGGFSFGFVEEALFQLAVDSTSHVFYVSQFEAIHAFHQNGEPAEFTAPGLGTNELPAPPGGEICGVAVDQNGVIYMSDYQSGVHVFAPNGEELTSFANFATTNLAVDTSGNLYVTHYVGGGGGIEKFTPSEFPVTTDTTYTSAGLVDTDAIFAVAIDPSNDDLYTVEHPGGLAVDESLVVQRDDSGAIIAEFGKTGAGALAKSEGVAVDATSEDVYSSDTKGDEQVGIWTPPPPVPPTVESASATNVTTTSANLRAQVKPNSIRTHAHFQYVSQAQFEASGFTGAAETVEVDLGSSAKAQTANGHASGLMSDTTYRFRVVAENENGEVTTGPDPVPSFNTFPAFPPGLPDGRAYELISPAQKTGEVIPPPPGRGFGGSSCIDCVPENDVMMPMQSAPDGEAVAYMGQAFSAGFAAGPNEYLGDRSAGGWGTQSISEALFASGSFGSYQAFSTDLSRSVLYQVEPTLSAAAPTSGGKGFANLYLRDESGSLQPLVTEAEAPANRDPGLPNGGGIPQVTSNVFKVLFAGANPGTAVEPEFVFSHVVFEANDALVAADPPNAPAAPAVAADEANLYEWFDGDLHLINVLPDNNAAAPGAAVGSGRLLAPDPSVEPATVDRAISEDGSRIFWSDEPSGQLYVRIDGEETREIDDPGLFLTAAADGSKVLLDDGCLYDVEAEECEEDLTQGLGGFEGILGSAEDLSRIYFVDSAVLPGGEENANEEVAEAGKNNLYAWNEGETTFVGVLLGTDDGLGLNERFGDWKPSRSNRTAQVTPDGRYLAFTSRASLSGYDSNLSGGGLCKGSTTSTCLEVFAYDVVTETLSCASCNPTDQRPLGPSWLTVVNGNPNYPPFPQQLNLAPGGQGRLFFESQDTLSPYDTNGEVQDVYQWEPNGVGDCKRAGGCVRLISSGNGPNDSFFLSSSAAGDDVFFVTRDQLSLADKDEQLDLYDARVGGGIAAESETQRPECQGEACQPAAIVPNDPTPSSAAFRGAGNVKERGASKPRCPKGKRKIRRQGKARCVRAQRKGHADKRRHERGANTNRGGAK